MIRQPASLALLAALLLPGRAAACPEPSPTILFHSCWGEAALDLLLLPEDLPLPPPESGRALYVTGAYTGTEGRAGGRPDPVGLFLRDGEVINRNLARMDGILLIDPDAGKVSLEHRGAVRIGGGSFDLNALDQRNQFITEASARGLSVMQSHLLVVGGTVDVREVEDAPAHVRRLLFTDAAGYGIYQTRWPVTLHAAAEAVAADPGAEMALNLDMGSFDFCLEQMPDGSEAACGVISRAEDVAKLSNLLRLNLR